MRRVFLYAIVVITGMGCSLRVQADGPSDNQADNPRRVPAAGVQVPEADTAQLKTELTALQASIDKLAKQTDAKTQSLLPDVQIFAKAVRDAIAYEEFLSNDDIPRAKQLLKQGRERAEQLLAGNAPWAAQQGLVVRGYVSRLDGSVQPYGVVVPASYAAVSSDRVRMDLWLHGRGEDLNEIKFLTDRQKIAGEFTPADTIVLHPYGRYCNAFKLAGEVDVLEAMEAVKRQYRIDPDRIAVRGFSMGGAGVWHFAVHYADRFAAANPGAGFAETPDFLRVFQNETIEPTPYEAKLLHMYDCTDWAGNLFHCPTVAYSGEIDKQKQAADIMTVAMQGEGLELRHIIGAKAAHKYTPEGKQAVEEVLDSIMEVGRDRVPLNVHFTTYTLRYSRLAWVTVDAMGEHWRAAKVDGQLLAGSDVELKTENVTALTLAFAPGRCPVDVNRAVEVSVDGEVLTGPAAKSDRSWTCHLKKVNGMWQVGALADNDVRKRHDLQGPIDDAFLDAFMFVRPTGKFAQPAVEAWTKAEMARAIREWRKQFRGEARVKDDVDVTDSDIAAYHLVLWGDAGSNKLIGQVSGKLPIAWTSEGVKVGEQKYPADKHVLAMICPNPLNLKRYVVLNSGVTYREYDYLNNARQIPKLPDWAVIDTSTPPNGRHPGKIVAADFFDEAWKLK